MLFERKSISRMDLGFEKNENIYLQKERLLDTRSGDSTHSQLISLDDKVYLHKLLSSHNRTFWPNRFILKSSSTLLQSTMNHSSNSKRDDYMILKQRSGYGSFGNSIISKSQALHFLHESDKKIIMILLKNTYVKNS